MIIGVVGLGLVGGSIAKAYKRAEGITVFGDDQDTSIMDFALMAEAIDEKLTTDRINECQCIFLATYPAGVIDWVKTNAPIIPSETIIIDCSGTKEKICDTLFPIAKEHGFTFIGGHPMAGTHQSGFKYSRCDLFDGEQMVIVPPTFDDIRLFENLKKLLAPIGFADISFTTGAKHDQIIAFTSQMPHIISNGFIKSETAKLHKGYSAGSYRDLTRVAWLNPSMWAELFLENKSYLVQELDLFIAAMNAYKKAIEIGDEGLLTELLEEGRLYKQEVDGP